MKNINTYISEKLVINKDTNVSDNNLDDLLIHFDLFDIYDKKYGEDDSHKLSNEEKEEIKSILKDFIDRNNCSKDNCKYYTNRGRQFDNKKIARDYIKDNSKWMAIAGKIPANKKPIFKKASLYFKCSDEYKIIEMCGPYGGIKICKYE